MNDETPDVTRVRNPVPVQQTRYPVPADAIPEMQPSAAEMIAMLRAVDDDLDAHLVLRTDVFRIVHGPYMRLRDAGGNREARRAWAKAIEPVLARLEREATTEIS